MVGRSKQLWNKSQEQLPVAVYVLTLGPDYDMILIVCCKLYSHYSLTPCHTLFSFVALLTLRVSARPGCLWSGSALGFPTSYQLITVGEKSKEVLCI